MSIDLEKLIKIIPDILLYFVPGIIFFTVYNFIVNKNGNSEKKETKFFSVENIIGSFIITVMASKILSWTKIENIKVEVTDVYYFHTHWVYIFAFSAILGIVFGLLRNSQWVEEKIVGDILKRTYNTSIWDSVRDKNKGCWVTAFFNNGETVYGIYYRYYNENDTDWIVVTQYIRKNSKGKIIDNYLDDNLRAMVIPVRELDKVEIIYTAESRKIHKKINNIPRERRDRTV